jgi:hypothetical protein
MLAITTVTPTERVYFVELDMLKNAEVGYLKGN